jgi:hypothetical protein
VNFYKIFKVRLNPLQKKQKIIKNSQIALLSAAEKGFLLRSAL